jgi:hypothetical protein
MPYSAEISRTNPTCFLFLVDQSGSMLEAFGAQPDKKKAQEVATAINRLLQTLVLRCAKGAEVLNRFHVGVIGYGHTTVGSAFSGALAGQTLVPIAKLAANPLRVELRTKKIDDGTGGLIDQQVKFPIWLDPAGNGQTPMCQAFDMAWNSINDFVGTYPDCFPPIVINITDGKATDGDPESHARCIRDLASHDGNVLLFNVHLSSRRDPPIELPDRNDGLPDDFARLLFQLSSILPPSMRETARREGYAVSEQTRGFVFNADLVSVIRFLDIGTRVDLRHLR